MIKQSLYKILGLQDFSSEAEIKKAYRALALAHHPDRGGDSERMKAINAAHDILLKRKDEYDARLRQAKAPAATVNVWYSTYAYSWDTVSVYASKYGWTFKGD